MFRILTIEECSRIHDEALHVLKTIGVRIKDKQIYEKLTGLGAKPGKQEDVLYFPEELVKWALGLCPKAFSITNRKGESKEVRSGSDPIYYTSNGLTYSRGQSEKVVEIGEKEFTDFIKVANQLENVDGLVGTSIKEYAPQHRDFAGFMLMAKHSYKHLRPCMYTPEGALAIIEMADVLLDGRSLKDNMFFTLGYSVLSPLTWTETALKLFRYTAGYGIPIMINSEPLAGATSPATMAGSLVLSDAEILSGIIINQVIDPGRPVIYNAGFGRAMDMRTGLVLSASSESALLQAGGAAMAAYHGLPSASWSLSDSVILDGQSAFEKMMTMFTGTLCKINMIWGIGNMEVSRTINPETAVIDDEMLNYCKRFYEAIPVNEDTLAADVIREVGFSGDYLSSDHTMRHFRDTIWSMDLANRFTRNVWENRGAMSIEERAAKKVDSILSKANDICLEQGQLIKLENIKRKWIDKLA